MCLMIFKRRCKTVFGGKKQFFFHFCEIYISAGSQIQQTSNRQRKITVRNIIIKLLKNQ